MSRSRSGWRSEIKLLHWCHKCDNVAFMWHLPRGQFWCWLSHSLMHSSQNACSQLGAYSGFSSTPIIFVNWYFFLILIKKFLEWCSKAQRDLFYIRTKPNGLYKDSYSRSPSVLNPAKIGHILLKSSRDQSGTGSHVTCTYPRLIATVTKYFHPIRSFWIFCKYGTHNLWIPFW